MLHYNFPPFSVGEAKPFRGTSRREVGHGNLAERAIQPLLPAYDDFPYTIRIVSDILESNGSSSMATVCGSSLALMDAGVPIKGPCAGVAMGLIKEGDELAILTDILGLEDALGDMDFKVAGTRDGVTSIQMDIKIQGLTVDVLKVALERAHKARLHILDLMDQVLSEARDDLSAYAPRIVSIQINPEKIGEIIGPKGVLWVTRCTGEMLDMPPVLVHSGTDTIAYTASALSFLMEGLEKPVILTGSQIPLCETRSDALENLTTGLLLIERYAHRMCEVCICFGGRLLRGNRASKTDSEGFDLSMLSWARSDVLG